MTRFFFLFYFFSHWILASRAQSGVVFSENLSYQTVLSLAKEHHKNILIDTYADWCIPCKKMETEFKIQEVGKFFNEKYINVRINMDHHYISAEYRSKFDIVFLPTIIIIDPDGNVKYKTDKIIPGRELMAIADKAQDPSIYFQSDATNISLNPISKNSTNSNTINAPIKTLHISGDQNPEYLYKEAYFRIELMDGSDKIAAEKYLATQKDWSTPKNLRFIFDFLYSSKTADFDFFGENQELFKKEIGEEIVNQSLEIFIDNEFNHGFPRPDYDRAKVLFGYLDKSTAERKAYEFYAEQLIQNCRYGDYEKFVTNYSLQHPEVLTATYYYNLASSCVASSTKEQRELNHCIENNKKAITLSNEKDHLVFEQSAMLFIQSDELKSARKALKKAISISQETNKSFLMADVIKNLIEQNQR